MGLGLCEACLRQTLSSSLQKNTDCVGGKADWFPTSCCVPRRKVNWEAVLSEPVFLPSIIKVAVNCLNISEISKYIYIYIYAWSSQVVLAVKNPPANAGDMRCRFDPWSGRSLAEGLGSPLQCSYLENPLERRGLVSIGLQRGGHD